MSNDKSRVACIGADVLGAPIMHGLIDRGFAPLVWNRDRNKLTSLLKAGQRRLRAPPSGLAPDPTKIAEHF